MRALFAGSFDPIHLGHVDIIERASHIFEELHVLVANSYNKSYSIALETRLRLVTESLMQFSNVYVTHSSGLTVEYAKANQIHCLVRGLRIMSDFEYEQSMDWHNHILAPEIETICLMTRPNLRFVSSRSLKELLRHGQDVQAWLPKPVLEYLKHHPI